MDKPPKEVQDEPGADERFAHGVANALRMPPQPKRKPAPDAKPQHKTP
jgi:hypothetical protein